LFTFGARAATLSNERVVVDLASLGVNHLAIRLGDVTNRTPRLGTRSRLGGALATLDLRDVFAVCEIDDARIVSSHMYYLPSFTLHIYYTTK
jgi:hypothetical protein